MIDTALHYKRDAAAAALALVEPGMKLGLGTGSTANEFIDLLAAKVRDERLIVSCEATSKATQERAIRSGLHVGVFGSGSRLDLTVDGADEIGPGLALIKGGGGALLYEKIVACASDRVCIIADSSKVVTQLGRFPLPVEIVMFGISATMARLREIVQESRRIAREDAGWFEDTRLRLLPDRSPFLTDAGHAIADCDFGAIPDVERLAAALNLIPGVVEHGLFVNLADLAITAGPEGLNVLGRDFGLPPPHRKEPIV